MVVRELVNKIGYDVDTAAMRRAENSMKQFTEKARKLGKNMTMFFSVPAAGLSALSLKMAADARKTRIAFETLTRSAEKGKEAYKEVIDFAAKTPFNLPGVKSAATMLLSSGVQTRNMRTDLQMLGDVAAGVNAPIQQLTRAFIQVKGAGRVMGEELMQFREAGVGSLIPMLSEVTGVSVQEISKNAADVGISFEDLREAFRRMTAEGGQFHGMLNKMSQDFGGLMTTVIGSLRLLAVSWGNALIETLRLNWVLTSTIKVLRRVWEWFDNLSSGVRGLVVAVTAGLTVAAPIIWFLSVIVPMIKGLNIVVGILNAKILLIPAIVASIVAAVYLAFNDIKTWVQGGDSIIGDFLGSWDKFAPKVEYAVKVVRYAFVVIAGAFKKVWKAIEPILKELSLWVFDSLGNAFKYILSFLKAIFSYVSNIVDGIINKDLKKVSYGVRGIISSFYVMVEDFVNWVFNTLSNFVMRLASNVLDFSWLPVKVRVLISDLLNTISVVTKIIGNILESIYGLVSALFADNEQKFTDNLKKLIWNVLALIGGALKIAYQLVFRALPMVSKAIQKILTKLIVWTGRIILKSGMEIGKKLKTAFLDGVKGAGKAAIDFLTPGIDLFNKNKNKAVDGGALMQLPTMNQGQFAGVPSGFTSNDNRQNISMQNKFEINVPQGMNTNDAEDLTEQIKENVDRKFKKSMDELLNTNK
jgi:hypothetical protein